MVLSRTQGKFFKGFVGEVSRPPLAVESELQTSYFGGKVGILY